MSYVIRRIKSGQPIETEEWQGFPFEAVKDQARNVVETGIADRAEVRDLEGKLVFQFPRVMRPA